MVRARIGVHGGQADFAVIVMQRSQDSLFSFLHRLLCSGLVELGCFSVQACPLNGRSRWFCWLCLFSWLLSR